MFRDSSELMTCASCQQAAILTVEDGLCPRCFYKQECEAICSAAEDEVDRVLTEGAFAPEPAAPEPARIHVPEEQVWGW
jgi:hypothetical protein